MFCVVFCRSLFFLFSFICFVCLSLIFCVVFCRSLFVLFSFICFVCLSLIFCVVFCRSLFVLFSFICIVCPSLIFCVLFYRSLFVLFLLAMVLSVLLRIMASDYPSDIFKLYLGTAILLLCRWERVPCFFLSSNWIEKKLDMKDARNLDKI